jgi:hypothetical protein
MRGKKFIFPFLGIFLFFSVTVLAVETGKINGRVIENNNLGIEGVKILAKSSNLQGIRSTVSSKNGDFFLPLLPIGKYTLTFEQSGFTQIVQENVMVHLGQVTSLKVKMELEKIEEEITITASPPLIDKTSSDTSFHLGSSELEKIPSQNRTLVDIIKFTPGVTGVRVNTRRGLATEGQPSFRGEGAEGNNWIVDGLSISDIRIRNSGMQLNFDAIEEVQIISDPFSPEYGSATGGIINVVTKSGGNDFSGEFAGVLLDKKLQANKQDQLALFSEPDFFSHSNWFFNLSGPLIKDKLWFFISNNFFSNSEETRDTTVDYLFVPSGKKNWTANNLFTKFTYAFNNSHNLAATAAYQKSLRHQGGTGIPELYENRDFSDTMFRFNYKGIFNSTTFIQAGLGYINRKWSVQPKDNTFGPSQYYIEDIARNINNSYAGVTDDQKRMDFSLKLTKFLNSKEFGHHEIDVGFEYYNFSSGFGIEFTGRDEDIFPGNGFDSGTKYYFDTWNNSQGTPTVLYEYGLFDFNNTSRGIGVYFKDKITWGRVTLMVGIRSQTQVNLDNKGEELFSWGLKDFLSPRMTFTVDITGDGKNVLKLGYGRFSDLITTMPLGMLNSGAGLTFRNYSWQGPELPSVNQLQDPANWTLELEQKTQPFEIASNITPNFLSRFLLEFDRRIGSNWAVAARYIHTKADNLLEILTVFDLDTQYKLLYDNFEYKRRKYSGVELELIGKIGSGFFLKTSYCYSSAKGTNPGQPETGTWSQDELNTSYMGLFGNHLYIPDLPGTKEIKEYYDWALDGLGGRGIGDEGWYGKLPYSIDHNFKLLTVMAAPFGFVLSTAFEYISGYYWEKRGYSPFFGKYITFPETRGSRETPGHIYLDLGIEKKIKLLSFGLSRFSFLTLRLDVSNLLNSQRPVSFVKEDIPIFGDVWARQQPRQARITAKFSW